MDPKLPGKGPTLAYEPGILVSADVGSTLQTFFFFFNKTVPNFLSENQTFQFHPWISGLASTGPGLISMVFSLCYERISLRKSHVGADGQAWVLECCGQSPCPGPWASVTQC